MIKTKEKEHYNESEESNSRIQEIKKQFPRSLFPTVTRKYRLITHPSYISYNFNQLTKTKQRIFNAKFQYLQAGEYVSFRNAKQTNDPSWHLLLRMHSWQSISNRTPHTFCQSFYSHYNNTSFWRGFHLFDIQSIDQKTKPMAFADSVTLSVAINQQTKKSVPVSNTLKSVTNDHWNKYPKELKKRYCILRKRFSKHLEIFDEIKTNNNILFSYCLQLRYVDQDLRHHITTSKYFELIEEAFMNWFPSIRKDKQFMHAIGIRFWIEIPLRKYRYIQIQIRKKSFVGDVDGMPMFEYFGTFDICSKCSFYSSAGVNKYQKQKENCIHENGWISHTGFVVQVVDDSKSKL